MHLRVLSNHTSKIFPFSYTVVIVFVRLFLSLFLLFVFLLLKVGGTKAERNNDVKIARKTGRSLGRYWKRIYFGCISTGCRKTKTKVIAKINIEKMDCKEAIVNQ